jgi:hypothetical protein
MSNNQIKYISSAKLSVIESKFNNKVISNKDGIITFEKDLSIIPVAAFAFSPRIEQIELPDSITKIDMEAFCATRKLKTVIFGNNVKELAYRAFHDCHALESIVLPESIQIIAEDAFDSCSNLKSINIPGNATNLGISIFSSCFSLENVNIEEGVKKLPDYTFRKCKALSEITLPTTIKQLGMKVFSGCTSLKTIYVKPLTPPEVPKEYIISGGINKNTVNSWLALKDVDDFIIYVPTQSLELYKEAPGWNEYINHIQPYEFPEYITPEEPEDTPEETPEPSGEPEL